MLTIAQHIGRMEHASGTDKDDDSRHDFYATFNQAGRYLTRERCWWWRLVVGASLPAVSGSASIALPSDFDTLDTITLSTGLGPVAVLTPQQYSEALANISSGYVPAGTRVLLPVMTYSSAGAETKVLKLLSTASANGTPTFTMSYYRSWVDVTSADDSDVASIPPDFDAALGWIAKAFVLGHNEQADSHEMVMYAREIAQLKVADSRRVPVFSPPRGGASDRTRLVRMQGPLSF